MAHYSKPSKVNLVSVLFFAGLVSLVYGGIFFGPAYWRKFQVSEVLDEVANKCRGNRVPNEDRIEEIKQKARQQILALGVEDQGARVYVQMRPKEVTVSADYKEVIRHPLINRTTTLHFRPELTRVRGGGL